MAVHVPIKGFLIAVLARVRHISTDVVSHDFTQSLLIFVVTITCSCFLVFIIDFYKKRYSMKKHRV